MSVSRRATVWFSWSDLLSTDTSSLLQRGKFVPHLNETTKPVLGFFLFLTSWTGHKASSDEHQKEECSCELPRPKILCQCTGIAQPLKWLAVIPPRFGSLHLHRFPSYSGAVFSIPVSYYGYPGFRAALETGCNNWDFSWFFYVCPRIFLDSMVS
jgi:hypothetical protein